jgi:hypothetical protein
MRPRRPIPLAIAAVAGVLLIVSTWQLAERIEAWNEANGRAFYYFFPVETTRFTFAGKPVEISDDLNDAGEGDVVIGYADDTLRIPVPIPNDLPLPGLSRHADWLRLHVFAGAEKHQTFEDFQAAMDTGEITSRLVAVVRSPFAEPVKDGTFGLETEEDWGWGEVRRDRWMFTFYEFLPDGGWQTETLRFPETGKAFYRRQIKAEKEGLPPPVRRDDELKEGTWQFDAAIPLMNRPPPITSEMQALRNAGWTLPVASASVIAIMLGLGFAFAPSRTKTRPAPSSS